MGNSISGDGDAPGFTIERSTVRNERDLVSQKRMLTPKEEERINEKREQVIFVFPSSFPLDPKSPFLFHSLRVPPHYN